MTRTPSKQFTITVCESQNWISPTIDLFLFPANLADIRHLAEEYAAVWLASVILIPMDPLAVMLVWDGSSHPIPREVVNRVHIIGF